MGGEVTKPAGRAGRRATCWAPVSPPARRSPHTWVACLPSPAVVGEEGPGPPSVMDHGAVHLCRLRDCQPVSAASCAPPRSSWRRRLAAPWHWTRGHRTSTPRRLLGALEEGEAPSAGLSLFTCVCVHTSWGVGHRCVALPCRAGMYTWHRPGGKPRCARNSLLPSCP